jgi:hypothetical protein
MGKRQRTPTTTVPAATRDTHELMSRIRERLDAFASGVERLEASLKRGIALDALLDTLRGLTGAAEPLKGIADELRALEKSWKDRADRELVVFEDGLRRECQSRGWRLDGQWPAFYVERAIPVVVDEKQRTVSVSEDKLQRPMVETVIERLEALVGDLVPRAFSARTFMASLAKAYDRIRDDSNQIPLLSVYRQMVCDQQKPKFWRNARSDAFVGMSIEQFRARLSGALEQGVTASSDRRELRMFPPIDPNDAVFLYQPAEARFGFVGRIEFLSADHGGEGERS